tara:strand:- start:858 stop:1349 length:492 start_codon:yes stop_codon:yes gene_type:complete
MLGAVTKRDKRVTPTLFLCKAAEYFKPEVWVLENNMSNFPLTLPDGMFIYGKHSAATVNEGQVEWRRYRRILEDFYKIANSSSNEEREVDNEDDNEEEVRKMVSPPQSFWDLHKSRLPCVYKLSISVFSFCPSAAEVERSFKKSRAILPKDHTRDCTNEASLR